MLDSNFRLILSSVLLILVSSIPFSLYSQVDEIEKKAEQLFKDKKYKESYDLYDKAIQFHRESNNKEKEIETMLLKFKSVMHTFDTKKAKSVLFDVIQRAEKYNLTLSYAEALNSLCALYNFEQKNDSLVYICKKILSLDSIPSNIISDSYTYLSNAYYGLGQPKEREFYLTKAIEIDRMNIDSSSLPFNLTEMADIYSLRAEHEKAIEYLFESLKYLRGDRDKYKYPSIYYELSRIFISIINIPKAEEYALKSLEYCNNFNLKLRKAYVLNLLATIERHKKNDFKALEYLKQSREIVNDNPKKAATIVINIGEAKSYVNIGEYEKAKKLLAETKTLLIDKQNEHNLLNFLTTESILSYKLDEKDQITKLSQAYNQSVTLNQLYKQLTLTDYLSKAYKRTGNTVEALNYFEKYNKINDSIFQLKQSYFVSDLEAKYQKKKQDTEIEILAAKNDLQKVELKQQRMFLYSAVIGLILFASLVSFILYLLKKVSAQKNVVQSSLDEKNILLKEIHHRVKNNLQVISSLLSLQTKYIKDDNALNALKEGQDRVHSMALIHQDLYQNKSLVGVSTQSYFEQLLDNLCYSYKINEEDIDLKMDVEDIELDVDTMIPLGLILNELVSNAFKHAFKSSKDGALNVALKEKNDTLILEVKDNGKTLTDIKDIEGKSFGFELVKAFSKKLKADMDLRLNNGLHIIITIKNYKLAA